MKRLTLFIALLVSTIMLTAQPTPELLYRQTEHNPTFIFVKDITIDIADTEDYIFAYGPQMQCWGAGKLLTGEQAVVPVMGNDNWEAQIQGYGYGDVISLGFFDAQTNRFYSLNGLTYSYPDDKITEPKWYPLSLYFYKDTQLGKQITLIADTELSAAELKIKALDTLNLAAPRPAVGNFDEEIYFSVQGKNIVNINVVAAAGGGTIVQGKWWRDHSGWCNYKYTPANTDNIVILNAVAQNKWDKSMLTAQKKVKVLHKVIPVEPPPADEVILYTDPKERFQIYITQFRKFGEYLFVRSLSDEPVSLSVFLTYSDKGRVMNTFASDRNDGRGMSTKNLESIQLYKGKFAGKLEYLPRTVISLTE